jgi:hypothetical protein
VGDGDVEPALSWNQEQARERDRRKRSEAFANQVKRRRTELEAYLYNDDRDWPPPPELAIWAEHLDAAPKNRLAEKSKPSRAETLEILRHRSKPGVPGLRSIAAWMGTGYDWKKVRWAVETFEDVIARNKEHLNAARLEREAKAEEAIARQKQELLDEREAAVRSDRYAAALRRQPLVTDN